ncbi:MAG: 50S ribosomal protein L10 [Candidatus Diapherotrites archaeon]
MTRHIFVWKEKEVTEIKELLSKYPVVAVANLENFPASLFQETRKKLAGKAVIKVSKTRVIQKALAGGKSEKLSENVSKSVALIFTEMNPFELYGFLKKNKGSTSAKSGMVAPADIVVPAGDTGLPPGPALSDLKAAGLKTKIEGSTIAVAEDKVVTKKGDIISKAVANCLIKLDIKPIKVGLNIVAVLENGEIYRSEVLNIDADEVFANFSRAYTAAFNLAYNANYLTKDTIVFVIQKSFREAKAVALEANIFTQETVEELFGKASLQADSLQSSLPEVMVEDKAEAPAKEEKAEKKKEKAKPAEEKSEEKKETSAEKKAEQAPAEDKKAKPAEEKKEKTNEKEKKKTNTAKEKNAAKKDTDKSKNKKSE